MAGSRGARCAMFGLIAAMLVVHGVASAWAPLAGDDWQHVLWAEAPHGSWLRAHLSFASAVGDALARVPWLHAVLSPVIGVVLLAGVFTLAARRRPDPGRWADVLGVALVSSAIWIALPRAGAMWFHRPYAAAQIYGAALVVWLAVPYRLRWAPPRGRVAWAAVMFVLGAIAATTTRQLAVAALIGLAIALARTPRPQRHAWMWLGLAGVVLGLAGDIARTPWWEAARLVTRFEPTLNQLAPLLRVSGQLVTLIGLLVLARVVWAALRPADDGWLAAAPDARATGDALAWLAAWLGLALAMRLGPLDSDTTLLPATLALVIAAWPYARWLASAPGLRWGLVALAVAVHAIAWSRALATYARLDGEYTRRLAEVARTPADGIAEVAPYREILADYWWIGDDWNDVAQRERLARDHFGLRDIDLAPAFRVLDRSPGLALALEVDGATEAQLRAAQAPATWPRSLERARLEFAALVARLRAAVPAATARLRITDLAFAAGRGRPIYAAWSDAPLPTAKRTRLEDTRVRLAIPAALAARYPEAWAVSPRGAAPLACGAGHCTLAIERAERIAIVLCDAERCVAAAAWVPLV